MLYIGIDLGGTNIAVGLVDENGKILDQTDTPTLVGKHTPEQQIADMGRLANLLLERNNLQLSDIAAIGAGVPGVADPETGVVPFCTNLFWHDVPLRRLLQQHINLPVFIENDATVAALAESVAGTSSSVKNSVFLTLGTGLGGGIVLDGKVYSGSHHVGSELGHMIVELDGDLCTCGNRGCWERYASATAIINMGKAAVRENNDSMIFEMCGGDIEKITAKHVIDAAKAGDVIAMRVFRRYVKNLAAGLVTIINFIDPEMIVLGGGVSHAGDFLLDAVVKEVSGMVFYKTLPYSIIKLAALGNSAGIIGAAMLGK